MTTALAILATVATIAASSAIGYSIGAASATLRTTDPSERTTPDNG